MPFKTLKELDPTEGTVLLFSATTRAQHVAGNDTILVPQPSDDPNDPLRWPKWRKHMAFSAVCMFTCFNNISGTVLSDSFYTISLDLGVSLDKASGLISWVILILGLGNFFWVPTAIYFGKRPVFLASCAITFAAAIWAAASPDFASLQAACIVGGFGGAASEALGAAIINDLYFLHERGSKMAWYMISLAFGSSLGPLCGGYIIGSKGWAWGKWVSAVLLGFNLLFIFFFAPETRFYRNTDLSQGASGTETIEKSKGSEKGDISQVERANSPTQFNTLSPTTSGKPVKTYTQLLNPWSGINSHESYWELVIRPIPLLAYPACAFATLTYSLCLAPTVMINVLSSVILIPPPYNFSVGAVGLLNVAGMIGQAVGAVVGGILIDKWVAWRAHRNNGIFQPETRLALIFIPGLVVFLGILLFGFAVEQQMSWAVIFAAYGFVSVGLTGGASISMTYVVDSYFPVQAECLEIINGLKNVVAFGFIKATIPWVHSDGYEKTFGTLSGIFCAILALALPLLIWGTQIRHYTSSHWRLISWDLNPSALKLCEEASNCEIRHTPDGRLDIGFQRGKEPGSKDYEDRLKKRELRKRSLWVRFGLAKRGEMHTEIAVGKGRLNYGWLTPSDALNALVDQGSCQNTMCTGSVSVRTDFISGPCLNEEYIILTPDADYAPGERDNWLSAMKEVFSHEFDTEHVDWSGSGDPNTNICGSGTSEEHWQANFIGMNRFYLEGTKKDFQGSFKVDIANAKIEDCGKATAAIGAAIGFISGIAGGFFGAIAPGFCSKVING